MTPVDLALDLLAAVGLVQIILHGEVVGPPRRAVLRWIAGRAEKRQARTGKRAAGWAWIFTGLQCALCWGAWVGLFGSRALLGEWSLLWMFASAAVNAVADAAVEYLDATGKLHRTILNHRGGTPP